MFAKLFTNEDKNSLIYLLQWLFLAFLAGFIGALFVQFFLQLYQGIINFIISSQIPTVLVPVSGALLVGIFIYRFEPEARGEGMPSYLTGIRNLEGKLPFSVTVSKFFASVITLGTFGNGGFMGPVGRVNAGILSTIGDLFIKKGFPKDHQKLFPICGLAAAIGALLHSPVGAGIFAVEIIQKANMRYRQLFPAILASTASVYFSKAFGFQPILRFDAIQEIMPISMGGKILLVSFAAGLLGKIFIILYERISHIFKRADKYHPFYTTRNVIVGSLLASFLIYFINAHLLGTSAALFSSLFSNDLSPLYGNLPTFIPLAFILLLLIAAKIIANCLTVGSGMSAGFAGPAILVGLMLGAFFAYIFGINAGTIEYFALLAAGFAGVFASVMNTPIATAVMTIELFGLFYSFPAGLASIIGFQVNRHNTLYDLVLDEMD